MQNTATENRPQIRLDVILEAIQSSNPPSVIVVVDSVVQEMYGQSQRLLAELEWHVQPGLDIEKSNDAKIRKLIQILRFAGSFGDLRQTIGGIRLEVFHLASEDKPGSYLLHLYRASPENMGLAMIPMNTAFTDSELRIVQVDQGFCDCLGMSPDEICTVNLVDLFAEREKELVFGIELFCGQLNHCFELSGFSVLPSAKPACLNVALLRNENGVSGYAVQFLDSLEATRNAKIADRVLQNAQFRTAYISANERYEWANKQYGNRTPFEGNHLCAMPISLVTGEKMVGRFRERLMKVLSGTEQNYIAESIDRLSEETNYFSIYQTPDLDDQNNVRGIVNFVIDVTESHKNALRMTEVLESSPSMASFINKNLEFEYVNQDYLDFLDLSKEEIFGKHILEVIGQERFNKYKQYFERVLTGEKVQCVDFIARSNSSHSLIDIALVPKIDNMGHVIGFYKFVRDITETNQNIRRLNTLLENSSGFCVLMDKDANIRFANQTFASTFGVSTKGTIGQHLSKFIGKKPFEKISGPMIEKTLKGHPQSFQNIVRLPNGQERTMYVNLFPDRDWNGEITGVYAFAMDNTTLVNVKNELSRMYANFEISVEHTRVGIIELDDARPDWCFTGHLELLLGLAQGELENSRNAVRDLIHPDDMDANKRMNILRENGQDSKSELRLLDADGNYRWFAFSFHGRIQEGATEWAGTVSDIDQLKNSQLDSEEQVNRRDEFLAMLSHELRNPLMAIQYSMELLNESNEPDVQSKMLSVVDRQTNVMSRLMDDLLDVARITQNRIHFEINNLDVNLIVDEVVTSLEPLFRDKNQHIALDLAVGNFLIDGDDVRVKQALVNLLHNASKYSSSGDTIYVNTFVEDGHVIIGVQDQGKGIESCDLESIFDLFSQTGPGKGSNSGMGVGLYLVRHIVEKHGGYVEATSKGSGTGSLFEIGLPLKPL